MTRQQAMLIAQEMAAAGYRFASIFSDGWGPWQAAGRNRQTGELLIISTPEQWQGVKDAEPKLH